MKKGRESLTSKKTMGFDSLYLMVGAAGIWDESFGCAGSGAFGRVHVVSFVILFVVEYMCKSHVSVRVRCWACLLVYSSWQSSPLLLLGEKLKHGILCAKGV